MPPCNTCTQLWQCPASKGQPHSSMPPAKLCLGDLSVIFPKLRLLSPSTCSTESVRNVEWGGHSPPPRSHGSAHWQPHLVSKPRLDGFRGLAHLRTCYFRQHIIWSAHASSVGRQTSEFELTVEILATAPLVPSHGTDARPGDATLPATAPHVVPMAPTVLSSH